MNFEGFSGNARAKEYISSAFANNALPHALLIAGERGIGKKTLAALISRALVCSGDEKPCNRCDSCKKALGGFHPDIRILGSEASSVGVREIRDLKRDALLRPNDADRKVYIIDNAGAMTHDAQDAFLKILEEPPLFTFFILLCYNYSDLLPTIVSRTAHITLTPLSDAEISDIIAKKLPHLSLDERNELIRTSGGVCSFLTDARNTESSESAKAIAESLVSRDELEIFKAFSSIEKSGRDNLISVLDELTLIMRDALVIASGSDSRLLSPLPESVSEGLAESFSPSDISQVISSITDAKAECVRNIGVSHITGTLICNFAYTAAHAALKG